MRVSGGRSPATGGAGGGGGGSVTKTSVFNAAYDAWAAGTYVLNKVVTKGGKIYAVIAPGGTSNEPPHSDWMEFNNLSDVQEYFNNLLS